MSAEVLGLLWQQIENVVFMSRDEFIAGLAHWDIEPVEYGGQLAFAVLTQGPEFHFVSFETGTPITLAMIRARLDPIMQQYGFVTTRTPKDGADRQHRFNRRYGFRVVGEDEFFVHYRMDKKCQ